MIVSPFQSFGANAPVDITEPWGEVARVTSVSGGKLTISGLDLSGLMLVKIFISGVTVTTDDSQVLFRFIIGGSEIATGYRWAGAFVAPSITAHDGSSNSDTSIHLTSSTAAEGVGNASTEGFGAVLTIPGPASTSLYKKVYYHSAYSNPAGNGMSSFNAGGQLDNASAVEGFVVLGSSDLTGGSMIVLGVE